MRKVQTLEEKSDGLPVFEYTESSENETLAATNSIVNETLAATNSIAGEACTLEQCISKKTDTSHTLAR